MPDVGYARDLVPHRDLAANALEIIDLQGRAGALCDWQKTQHGLRKRASDLSCLHDDSILDILVRT